MAGHARTIGVMTPCCDDDDGDNNDDENDDVDEDDAVLTDGEHFWHQWI